VCEVNAGGAVYATTADLLAMVAPRALLVISATKDALQFSVGEAAKSVAIARERFRLLGQEAKIGHLAVDSGHDYNQAMREAMYGWVEKWLCDRGDGGPVKEPETHVEAVAALRCYPDGKSRPKSVMTIPEFAYTEGQNRLAALPKPPDHKERWNADAERLRGALRDQILGGFPRRGPLQTESIKSEDGYAFRITTESGIRATASAIVPPRPSAGTALIVTPRSSRSAGDDRIGKERNAHWLASRFAVLNITDSRLMSDEMANVTPVAGVTDHDPAEWGLWVGRPLLGQWTWDVVRWLDFLDEQSAKSGVHGRGLWKPMRPYVVIGLGAMSLPVLLAGGLDPRVAGVCYDGGLVSYVGRDSRPWSGVPMGLLALGILNLADVGHLAALLAPRPIVVSGVVEPQGEPATSDRLNSAFDFPRRIYELFGAVKRMKFGEPGDLRAMVDGGETPI
jgi:hypothetical protein